ncbi:MAG: sigma factor-like helix-turn-helix DNA-binding protein [Patescibacteria group bacterium]
MTTNNTPTPNANLLDRVLQSQQSETLEHFDPLETVNQLLKLLSSKEADVLRRRYGLGPNEPETLEVIGRSYQVTRERVRQIQHWAIKHLRQAPPTNQLLHGLTLVLQQLLESRGGLMLEEELLQRLQGTGQSTRSRQAAVRFLLAQLLNGKVERVEDASYKPYWKSSFANLALLASTIAAAERILIAVSKPVTQSELLRRLAVSELVHDQAPQLTEDILLSYLSVSTNVERNPFGELGLRTWGTIVPKRMHDKILLVMRKHGRPMHFQEITKRINEIGFDHRQAYPPTVHNELILNKEYVLVGRGIYALREWGYKPGVVADVLVDILRQAGAPLTRDELIAKVLQQRLVKKNTIALALTNKKTFRRLADGRYGLADQPAPATGQ